MHVDFGIHKCQVCGKYKLQQVEIGEYTVCENEECQAAAERLLEDGVEKYYAETIDTSRIIQTGVATIGVPFPILSCDEVGLPVSYTGIK